MHVRNDLFKLIDYNNNDNRGNGKKFISININLFDFV